MQIARQFGNLNNYSIYQLNNKMGLAGSPDRESEQRILTQPEYDVIYPSRTGRESCREPARGALP